MHQRKFSMVWVLALFGLSFIVGCGGSNGGNGGSDMADSESNIPYLRDNHANYKEYGSNQTPAPTKDAGEKSINWTIEATTQEGAVKLQEHLSFMEEQLVTDQNPRPWDKLFLMEAYMKYNKYYTTHVERNGNTVVVTKVATTPCAYAVISAHSDAVSGDFFGKGEIGTDYSSVAESILASSDCTAERTSVEAYIASRLKQRG